MTFAVLHIATDPKLHILFDLSAWLCAGGAGWWVKRYRLAQVERLAEATTPSYFIALALGAIIGAWFLGSLNSLRWDNPTLSHSIGGALAGGIIAVELWKWRKGVTVSTGASFVPVLAVGIMIGRLGCLAAGPIDGTSGVATNLPWAVELGDGIARHPVQLYESAAMLLFLIVFFAFPKARAFQADRLFYSFIAFYAGQRFIWEFLKPYPPVMLGLNVFHFLMLGLLIYAVTYSRRAGKTIRTV
jgi:phosphatidylglycerol---prolipoprotein diacylglyceryl transferase